MSFLKIYRSSAGSGKTTKLAEDYIKLLFDNLPNSRYYQHILAITFTNKAKNEMKNRIISDLYDLSRYDQQKDSSDKLENLFKILQRDTGVTDHTSAREKASLILRNILHNYSFFSVSTIDSFFQRVIRGFARETGLQAGYNIELDEDKVLQGAVDKLLLEAGTNDSLRDWLIRFAEERMEEGKIWNFRKDILMLGKELFKERFKRFNTEFKQKYNKGFLDEFYNKLKEEIEKFKLFQKQIVQQQHRNVWTKQNKIHRGEIKRISDLSVVSEIFYKTKIFHSAIAILKNFHTLGILLDLLNKIMNYRNEKNIFLISDSSEFLREITKDTEVPFIYEKIGTTYKHYMIDEFQDTSAFQWENFLPLLKNSLSQNYYNLIVGDIKQSIYRWRNSDWNLLHTRIKDDITPFAIKEEILDKNWRSSRNIVYFNNAIFSILPELLQENFNNNLQSQLDGPDGLLMQTMIEKYNKTITSVYQDVKQELPQSNKMNKKGGYICFEFIKNDDEEGLPYVVDNKKNWEEIVKSKLPDIIKQLQESISNGQLKDIAVLVRKNREGSEIANYLLEKGINVISEESLFLRNATSVRIIICALKYLDNPEDAINKAELLFLLYSSKGHTDIFHKLVESPSSAFNRFEFVAQQSVLKKLPLYELVEMLISIFSLIDIKGEYAYLQAFQDVVLEYLRTEPANIISFINWWEEFGIKRTVNISELQDAVRIMTIHKAKGLGFKAVIVPFCNWSIDHDTRKNIIWCDTHKYELFNQLPFLPLTYTQNLKETVFAEDYFDEKLKTYIDNLNLLYVAFTRAKEALYCFSELPEKNQYKRVSDFLYKIFSNLKLDTAFLSNYTWDGRILKIGELMPSVEDKEDKVKPETKNISLKEYKTNRGISGRLTIYNHSKDFFIQHQREIGQKINYGKLMHEILSQIKTSDDIDRAVNFFIFQGKLTTQQGDEIKQKLFEIITLPEVNDWFTEKWKVKKEHPILLADGTIKKPDRVMIRDKTAIVVDFKFTEHEKEEHITQIKDYIASIRNMGYSVKGYIFYAEMRKLVDASPSALVSDRCEMK